MPTSARSLWLGRIALALAGSAVGLGLAEAAVRVLWPDRAPPDAAALPVLHTQLELVLPNQRAMHEGVLHRTNRLGLRGPDYPARPAPSVFRILLGGDSIAMGHGVPEEDRYSDRLVPLLDAARPGERHEVVNTALSGLDAQGVMQRIDTMLTNYGAHALVYGFCLNDIEGPDYQRRAPAWDAESVWAGFQESQRAARSRLWALLAAWRWRLTLPEPGVDEEVRYNYLENPAAWQTFTSQLDRLATIARERGVCSVLFLQPQLAQLDDRHPYLDIYARVGDAARQRGIHVIDAFPAFRGRFASWYWVGPFDPHPNAAGHAILARALAGGLLALPESCWRGGPVEPAPAWPPPTWPR